MDWLKSILLSLPLEKISDILGEIVIWWSQMVKGVPPADLPTYAYIGGVIVVLALWILVARMLPRPLGGMSWIVLFAVLLAPGTALGDPSLLAPASISVVYAVMMKDATAAISNALPILVMLVAGLFIGFVWQLIRGAFESSLEKARRRTTEDSTANMQLATGNYLAEKPDVIGPTNKPFPARIPVIDSLVDKIPVVITKVNATKLKATKIITTKLNDNKKNTTKIDITKVNTTKKSSSKNDSIQTNNKPVTKRPIYLKQQDISPKDISLKKDRDVKIPVERKKIEGFYSKKVTEEPVVVVDKDSKDTKDKK
ncbi:hypothetical protein [Psychrobacter urativorans]|uniref:hypothetical protein n=1 Tax=Psychrobacter urativorans TaxID=45610 RepID=UPI001D10EA97|nr:hypothetical protein [Psychrobacter urativorans]